MSYYSERQKNNKEINLKDYEIDPKEHEKLDDNYQKLQKLLLKEAALREEIAKQKEDILKNKYETYSGKIAIHYERTDAFYDWITGLPVSNADDYDLFIEQRTIDDMVIVPLGTDLKNGALIFGKYNTKINSQKGFLKKTFDSLNVLDIEKIKDEIYYNKALFSKDFLMKAINDYYDFQYKGENEPYDLCIKMAQNKSAEIIIKEVQGTKEVDKLLDMEIHTAMPVNKILGISKPLYAKIKEEGLMNLMIDFRRYAEHIDVMNLFPNENEIYNFLKETKKYLSDAVFYGLSESETPIYGNPYNKRSKKFSCSTAIKNILQYYKEEAVRECYSFRKFYTYIYQEVINQGYPSCEQLASELKDYLQMCKLQGVKPKTDSSSLNILHNITTRNHKVVVKEQEEETFKKMYENEKNEKVDDYIVVVPNCTNDIKSEGDSLCHCVSSYIKRILDGECKIYFLRQDVDISLITFEVRNGAVVQVRGSHNRVPSKSEKRAISTWAEKHNLGVEF